MAERRSYYSGHKISREELAQMLHALGVQGDALWRLVAIAGRESGYDPGAHGTDQPRSALSGDRGLFQINYVHDDALRNAGIINSPSDLFDPVTNIRAALFLSNGGSNLSPWNAGPGGWTRNGDPLYGTDPMAAQAAVNNARESGWRAPTATAGGGRRGAGAGGPESLGDIAEGLGNLGAPGYRQYATDPRRQINSRYQALMARFGGRGGGGGSAGFGDLNQFNWSEHPELAGPGNQYSSYSPHLAMFEKWVTKNYGGSDLGGYNYRNIAGSSRLSPHAFGAAFDWGPSSREQGLKAVQTVINNPAAFGIQAVHDYAGGRIWHADRAQEGGSVEAGWKPYDFPADDASDTHFHFEVTPETWDDNTRQNWQWMNQAMRGTFREGGRGTRTLTPEQFGQFAQRLGNRGNPLFEDYATIGPRMLQRRQNRWTASTPGQPGGTEGPPSQALTSLLKNIGIRYPDAPTPTPSLLAYLAGVGLDLSTAEDLRRVAMNRIRVNTRATRQDVNQVFRRGKENLTTNLISRGVLSSGEANKRYTQQAQDRAGELADLARQSAQLREDAGLAYGQSVEGLRRGAITQIADLDTQQQIQEAINRATARGARRAGRVSQRQFNREQAAREASNQALIDLITRLGRQGVAV